MAEPLKRAEESPSNADEARKEAEEYHRQAPTETQTHGMEREPEGTSLSEDIRARTHRPHKGDVGGAGGANEEIFQGSKQKELK
jgi:hypothetical protein